MKPSFLTLSNAEGPSFLPSFPRFGSNRLKSATGNALNVLLALALTTAAIPSAFCQVRFHIETDCPCEYKVYLMGSPDYQFDLASGHPVDQNIPFDPGTGQIAIKLIGCGVGIPPTAFPPIGSIINVDGSGCDCVMDGNAYTPNFQFGYDPEHQVWMGRLTCKWHE